MKSFFHILACLFLFSFSASSQITIHSTNINPVGFVAGQATDTLPDASIQPDGTGLQNWDFTALQRGEAFSTLFPAPAGTPYFGLFPTANIAAFVSEANTYVYFEMTPERLSIIGSYGFFSFDTLSVNTGIVFTQKQSVIRFPANFNDAYTENSQAVVTLAGSLVGVPYDSVRLVSNYIRDVKIDAYGQMTTPDGNYETLRSTETETKTDSVYIKSGPVWFPLLGFSPTTLVYYNWWTSDLNLSFPVVQLVYNPNSGKSNVSWLTDYISSASEKFAGLELNLYPNPGSDLLNVSLPDEFTGTVEIYDLNGRMQLRLPFQGANEQLNLQALVSGSYVLVLKNKNGSPAGSKRFEIIR